MLFWINVLRVFRAMTTKLIHFFIYVAANLIRFFKLTEFYQPTYNPNNIFFVRGTSYERLTNERIDVIKSNIDLNEISTYLDVGSQLGYFVYKINEANNSIFATGIEMNKVSYMYSVLIGMLNNSKNTSFINSELTADNVHNMPCYDVISCLNVFHHIVHFRGFEVADKIMKVLYKKTNKCLIFETGQYNEKGHYWTNDLGFMGDAPIKWIIDYLKKLGFYDVKLISKFKTHLGDEERGFFICTK